MNSIEVFFVLQVKEANQGDVSSFPPLPKHWSCTVIVSSAGLRKDIEVWYFDKLWPETLHSQYLLDRIGAYIASRILLEYYFDPSTFQWSHFCGSTVTLFREK